MPELKDKRWEKFAQLKAVNRTGKLFDWQMYVQAGFSESGATAGASRLLARPQVRERIKELGGILTGAVNVRVRQQISKVLEFDVQSRVGRVLLLTDQLRDLLSIVADRKVNEFNQDVPGGSSGYIVARPTFISGPNDVKVGFKEASFDRSLSVEIRAIQQQIAQELGQWEDKSVLELNLQKAIDTAAPEELEKVREQLLAKKAAAMAAQTDGRPN